MSISADGITQLLRRVRNPLDQEAREELYRRIESDLYQAARALRARMSPHRTFQTTELVNEACAKLFEGHAKEWADRKHFIRTAIVVMKNKILDYARKRKPDQLKSKDLSGLEAGDLGPVDGDLVRDELRGALETALNRLQADDPETHEVFVVRYFGACRLQFEQPIAELLAQPSAGELLTFQQVAEIVEAPLSTVAYRWQKATMYLAREMKKLGQE